jgi:hypothetical protein
MTVKTLLGLCVLALILFQVLGAESFGRLVVRVVLIPLAAAIAILPAWWIGERAAKRASLRKRAEPDKSGEPGKFMGPLIVGALAAIPVFLVTTTILWLLLQHWF